MALSTHTLPVVGLCEEFYGSLDAPSMKTDSFYTLHLFHNDRTSATHDQLSMSHLRRNCHLCILQFSAQEARYVFVNSGVINLI